MKSSKVGIFVHEEREASTQYYSAPDADMDRRAVVDIFFSAADGWFAEICDLHGSQCRIVRNHYLREYPVLVSGILSKKEVRSLRYFSSTFFDFDWHAKGLCRHDPLQACAAHKNTTGWFA